MIKTKLLSDYKTEILSGLTVSLALVPEAIAFAFVADLDPLVGLYAAFIIGLITSIFGGRPGMISGATGALAVVMAELFLEHPSAKDYLFIMVIIMGCFQILFGLLKLGKLVRLIPEPVMFGFVNGLAIVIFKAQFSSFKIKETGEFLPKEQLIIMGALIIIVMLIIQILPKLTRAVPPALAAIVVTTLIVIFFKLDTKTVGDVASVSGGFPIPHLPKIPNNMEMWGLITKTALVLASVGLIESLMTLTLIDERTKTRGKSNKESIAQGLANVITGLFGGMGGCAMIGQSMINIESGGRKRASGISASLFLLSFIIFGSSIIEQIPVASLVGVMFMVVIGTFEWETFNVLKKIPKSDALVILVVTIVTVLTDLAVAVFVGIIISALVFAWESAKKIGVKSFIREDGALEYDLHGAIFFASTTAFKRLFDFSVKEDEIYIDFKNARVFDHSAIESINWLTEEYKSIGKKLHLLHLSYDCVKLLKNAAGMIEVNVVEDPEYKVSDDELA
ncbi:SulP family inorganic anion transporter [Thiospirochaeta perfilievii]|uniref:SulP family inorganic anion transporter n=1 Tax=Thiospirochaeta perfilievii TaxID=252967 RepID=A0A5C1Q5B9_9SPIO|nr:SulP family inorganic anion transporter [Thiospirochaeta perfilievii]QEN03225.1 SulP family inorganic anion transporter [Thiospirochaeta perfilievii]